MKVKGLSKYKYKRIAEESLRNALRLHLDSILLFEKSSYPSAFQLSVLSLEEFSKAKWVAHCYDAMVTNGGFPTQNDDYYDEYLKDEQSFLKLLYNHSAKQFSFFVRELWSYSPKFIAKIKDKKLDLEKQQATYVGLDRLKRQVDTSSRISIPHKKINRDKALEIISLLNHEFIEIHGLVEQNEYYWGCIDSMDKIINNEDYPEIFNWPFKTNLKSSANG